MVIIVSYGQSIQHAVDIADGGDTILVREGTFHQSVTVPAGKNGIRIIGAGAGKTFLDGTGLPAQEGIAIRAAFVTVAGFTVRNFDAAGALIDTANDTVFRDSEIIDNTGEGILVAGSNRTLIKQNVIRGNGLDGIRIDPEAHHRYVIGNVIANNNGNGIRSLGSRTFISQNEISGNGVHGIEMAQSENWVIENTIRGNALRGISDDDDGSADCFFSGNACLENGGDGLSLAGTGHMVIENRFGKNSNRTNGSGIQASAGDIFIYGNHVEENEGTNIIGAPSFSRSLLLANAVRRSGDAGIDFGGGKGNRILSNAVSENAGAGIAVDSAAINLIDNNKVDMNRAHGVRLASDAQGNAVRSNRIEENEPFDILAEPRTHAGNAFDFNDSDESSLSGSANEPDRFGITKKV